MRPRAALFDVDGTLIDSVRQHAEAWAETFARFGFDIPVQAVHDQIGKGGDLLLPALLPPAVVEDRREELEAARGELFRRDYLPTIRAVPGARALLERLRAEGVRIALASSCDQDELPDFVRIADVAGLYDAATTSADAKHSKPCPDIFQAALAKLGVEAGDAVAIGDSPWDAKAASAAGVRTLGVLSGGFPAAELRAAGCVEIWRDCANLLESLERSLLGGG